MPERHRQHFATVSIGFPVSLAMLWQALADFPQMHRWFVGVRHVHVLEGGVPRVGAHRHVRFVGGHRATELITWWEPPPADASRAPAPVILGQRSRHGAFRLRVGSSRLASSAVDIDVNVSGAGNRSRVRWQIGYRPSHGAFGHALGVTLATPALRLAVTLSLLRLRRRLARGQALETASQASGLGG